ncbi:MAG: radical SAM protein [SAR202 cluster bacterium]|nr:radical SAM protein [SAR202 cluster bacterium]
MKKHDIFWTAGAVRCTSVTYEDLKFYKEHNLIFINFGIETGSQKMLDIMEKKNTTETIYNVVSNCKKLDISTFSFGFLFGMPGETEKTVKETAEFRALLSYVLERDWNVNIAPFLVIAILGTPLYEYCQQIRAIGKSLDEEEDYLIRLSEFDNQRNILNYLNKTTSSTKEVHYWLYLYQYEGKKAYLDLIIKNNKSIKHKLLQIYKYCIKGIFSNVVFEYNKRKDYYKNKKLSQKMKWYTVLSINFLLSLSVLFLPKMVLFPIVRFYANMKFYYLHKIHKSKKDKQKYNLFVESRDDPTSSLRFTENRITKTSRQIDRSLRRVVTENRKQMKPAITDEEIGLQILAKGQ